MKSPAMRYHGAKFRLAPWVISHFPEHTRYVESFGGAAGVLLRKPRAYSEVYNDLNGDVANFFKVVRDPALRDALISACVHTPYSRDEFMDAWQPTSDAVECARRLCIRACMGFGGAGAVGRIATGFRIDSMRKYSLASHLWARYPETLAAIGERFAGVIVENRPALDVIRQHDGPETLHYVDPPYMHETRCNGSESRKHYKCDLSDAEHIELLTALKQVRGHVVLSGYDTEMYNDLLTGWSTATTEARISAGSGAGKRTEKLWMNFEEQLW